jgi:hypothetical protein
MVAPETFAIARQPHASSPRTTSGSNNPPTAVPSSAIPIAIERFRSNQFTIAVVIDRNPAIDAPIAMIMNAA